MWRGRAHDDGLVLVGRAWWGTLGLFAGMIAANRPWRVVLRLSRLTVSALVTGAASLTQTSLWQVSGALSWVRLSVLTVVSLTALVATLVVMHGLWERPADDTDRDRTTMFNLTTVATLSMGVALSYGVLFCIIVLASALVLVPPVLSAQLHHPTGPLDYVLLAWFTSSLATVGGALGSAAEKSVDVRAAAYGYHPDRAEDTGRHL